jgi:predicted nucleic acid-binding protein
MAATPDLAQRGLEDVREVEVILAYNQHENADGVQNSHRLWAEHVEKKRSGHAGKRPVADVLIEAFAQRFQGLITRNPKHFTSVPVVVP